MESISVQEEFEELVAELEKLRTASTLIDDAARQTHELTARAQEVAAEAAKLLEHMRSSVDAAVGRLTDESKALQSVHEALSQLTGDLEQHHAEHAEALKAQLDKALQRQLSALEQHHSDQQSANEALSEALDRVAEQTAHQVGGSLGQLAEAVQRNQEQVRKAVDQVSERMAEEQRGLRRQLKQEVSARVDSNDRLLKAVLVLQVAILVGLIVAGI